MTKKGYSKGVSNAVAEESFKNHSLLARAIAEEEYGLREEILARPRKAGLYSGLSNMLGGIVPLIPYFLPLPIFTSVILSVIFAGVALAITAFIIAILASLRVKQKITEMILVGLGTAGATYIIGRAVSMILGIHVG